jgi:undecaprenyl-diphosphatase
MTSVQAVILGLVQGLTEFFPVSSSAHLLLVPWLFGWQLTMSLDLEKTFDVALHLGTFLAVLVLMRVDVWRIIKAFLGSIWRRKIQTRDEKLAWLLLISTIPAGIVGVAFENVIESKLGQPWLMAILLIVFGFIMWGVDSWAAGGKPAEGAESVAEGKTLTFMRWYHALAVGVAQAVALAPGVSRSGVTLTALRGLKMTREEAVRYSFLLTIPIIGGSAVYKGLKVAADGGLPSGTALPFAIGIVTALASGYLAARFLLGYVRSHSLRGFVWYRFSLGALILVLIVAGVRGATMS